MRKFRKRYVLGEGWPWYEGNSNTGVGMCNCYKTGSHTIKLKIPDDLFNWTDKHPKYRLVLERIEP